MPQKFFTYCLLFLLVVSCSEEKDVDNNNYLLKNISSDKTNIDFENNLIEDKDHSIINYIYFYNGGGVSAGDINNDGLQDLYFVSNQGENKLYINKGNLTFEDVTKKANVAGSSSWSTGSTMVDINGDGLLDIYVCAVSELLDFKGTNELFINNGDGTFTEKAAEYGLDFKGYSTQSYFFDYDKDGDLDVYIVNHAVHTSLSHGKASQRNKRTALTGDVLLQNNNGKFEDVSDFAGIYGGVNGYGLSASIADFNNDGWDDIYVCNDFHEDDYYYINNKNGTFTEQLGEAFATISRFSMGSDASDINNDGFTDVMTLDMLPNQERVLKETEGDDAMLNMQANLKNLGYKDQYSRNMLQINGGDYFYETALFNKVADTDWSWSPLFADFDNDGHQDLFISNGILRRPNGLDFKKYVSSTFKKYGQAKGLDWLFKSINEMPDGSVTNQIFKGNSKRFTEETGNWIANEPSLSNGAIYVDLDNDGDLDIVTNNVNSKASVYENTSNSNNSVAIKLAYKNDNKEGIGAKVELFSNGKKQTKQVYKSRGFLSSIPAQVHFGLDTITKVDSIRVIWPDNTLQVVTNIDEKSLQNIAYTEGLPSNNFDSNKDNEELFKKEDILSFKHQEDNYNDFFQERLIPYKISTLGPAIAVGDVDKNGFDDVYLGGASGKEGQLFLNNGRSFKLSSQATFSEDANFEDNAATFFDADNDGDLDLYVVSGVNERRNKNFEIDRLYLNNRGKFARTKTFINPLNTSSVDFYDYDNDGDNDVFIGNLSNPDSFGSPTNSAVLQNDGKGKFNADASAIIESNITNAIWVDINNDNQKDLLVSCEWDAPKVFINSNGKLTEQKLPENINGLWQTITAFDLDNDGDKDILLGNWGKNNRLTKYMDNPIKLYYGDFDSNGKKETLLAYNIDGKYYPLNTKDELSSQMNFISKKFVNHADFAMKTVEEIFTKEALDKAKLFEIQTLSSGYLKNDNGTFTEFIPFSKELQLAPITTFTPINLEGEEQLFVAGNSLKVNTYHGGYKALKGYFLNNKNKVIPASTYGISHISSQVKDARVVKMRDRNLLLIVANNDSLQTYSFK